MGRLDLPERYNVGADLLDRNLKARATKVAIHSAAGDLTYGDLHKLACGAARSLLDLGVRREERVLIVAYDSPGWVAYFLGAIRIGAVPVPVNPLLQHNEDYDHYLDDSLARVIVVDGASDEGIRFPPVAPPCALHPSHRPGRRVRRAGRPDPERTTWPSGCG
jgi:benzoate-CoA ligase